MLGAPSRRSVARHFGPASRASSALVRASVRSYFGFHYGAVLCAISAHFRGPFRRGLVRNRSVAVGAIGRSTGCCLSAGSSAISAWIRTPSWRGFGRHLSADSDAISARIRTPSRRGFGRHLDADSDTISERIRTPSRRGFGCHLGAVSGAISALIRAPSRRGFDHLFGADSIAIWRGLAVLQAPTSSISRAIRSALRAI